MSTQHTPGPWVIENPLEPDLAIVEAGKEAYDWAGRFIAHVPHYERGKWEPGHFSTAEINANARLIAAAPDLLEVMNYVADMTYCGVDAEWHFKPGYNPQLVIDAIAKATGQ